MARFLLRLWQAWLARREVALTREALHALSDHRLRDLGVERSAINSLFR